MIRITVYCGAVDHVGDRWGCGEILMEKLGDGELNPKYLPWCDNPDCTNGPNDKYPYQIVAEEIW